MTSYSGRYPEIDIVRGIAIDMMVFFHFFVDLSFLGIPGPDPFAGLLKYFGLLTASLFILISGISAHIKSERTSHMNQWYLSFLKRGTELILIGIGISIVTYFFLDGVGYVLFGILHLIGFSLLLAPLIHKLGRYCIIPALGLILLGWLIPMPFRPLWLVPIGIHPVDFISIDYTPIIPWFSVFLIGFFSGIIFFPNGKKRWCVNFDAEKKKIFIPLIFSGRHSLIIYLVHQPLLILLLSLLFNRL